MGKKEELEHLRQKVFSCRKCPLYKTRNSVVFGEGNENAEIMFIGEAPGKQEDLQGRPFVGAAGKLLTKLIEDILKLKRSDVYIANVLKCRPPGNRDPKETEIIACKGYLERQIEIINPKIICALGRFAASFLAEKYKIKFNSIMHDHGKVFFVGDKRIVFTFHPAAALYKPYIRELLEKDFKILSKLINSKKNITLYDFQ